MGERASAGSIRNWIVEFRGRKRKHGRGKFKMLSGLRFGESKSECVCEKERMTELGEWEDGRNLDVEKFNRVSCGRKSGQGVGALRLGKSRIERGCDRKNEE